MIWKVLENSENIVYVEKIHWKFSIFFLKLWNQFHRQNKISRQTCLRHVYCSKFHQLSGEPIHFWCKSYLKGENCKQSRPIKKLLFLKLTFPMGQLCRRFLPLKQYLQQKWMASPESWGNVEKETCLKHVCIELLWFLCNWF